MKIEKTNDGLKIIKERNDQDFIESEDDILEILCQNGFDKIYPEEIGALTSSILLSDDCVRDDHGNVIVATMETVYWHPNYAIENFYETFMEKGEFTFPRA